MRVKTAASGRPTACMIAYATYATDARIKNYVSALLDRGYAVDVFALGGGAEALPAGLRVFPVTRKHWGSSALGYAAAQFWFALLACLLVSFHFAFRRYRLIHAHNMPNFLVFCAILPKLAGAKVILDVHDTMPEAYATKFDLPLTHPLIGLLRWEELLSARFADAVITTNDLHRDVLASHGIAVEKIEIVMNVANERFFRLKGDASSFKRDGLVLIYHGTIAERLGIDLILRGMHLAVRECPKVRMILIGEGDFLPTVRALVEAWGLSERVEFVGFVPVESLPTYLARADLGIVGNRAYTEAKRNYMLPVKMLEYAAMGIPTIAPRLRTLMHYFDESSALFYRPDDVEGMARRIVEAYHDPRVIAEARLHLDRFNRRYNWTTMDERYQRLIDRLSRPRLATRVV